MDRFAIEKLNKWRLGPNRKPLVLTGARQVGKTWLLKSFGQKSFSNLAYVAFDGNPELVDFFKGGYSDIKRLIMGLQAATGVPIVPNETLIVFDEVQLCSEALTSLKYWQENASEYAVIAAGSLLGLHLQAGSGYPVGKTDSMTLYPMSFGEFLLAVGESGLWEILNSDDKKLCDSFASRLTELLKIYFIVGGMPGAVAAFLRNRNPADARDVQLGILSDYDRDFAKHVPKNQLSRIRSLWRSLPVHLAKEDKRFVASQVSGVKQSRDLRDPFIWLESAALAYRVWNVTKPAIPLAAYQNHLFKFFGLDVGLFAAQSSIPVKALLEGNRLFTEFKGALVEQYVQQELRASCAMNPFYWSRADSQAEVDFLVESDDGPVPIEAKAERNVKAKSLGVFREKFLPPIAVRTSLSPYSRVEGLVDIPLYSLSSLKREISIDCQR
jgi:predicted AAA+ superfamily ATPase